MIIQLTIELELNKEIDYERTIECTAGCPQQ